MIVCLCSGADDKEVRAAIRSGARSVSDVTNRCGAGGGCGSCREMVADMIADGESSERRRLPLLSPYLDPSPA